jgi:uncharacterized protein
MNKEQKFSDEFLSAFVDDELTPEEKAQVYARLAEDEALNIQVCELRKVRDLVALAYRNVPAPAPCVSAIVTRQKCSTAVAAGIALVVGGLGGWFLHPQANSPQNAVVAQAKPGSEDLAKILFHVSDDDMGHLKTVLDEVENLMQLYRRTHQKARVEVITNGSGLSLLMADVSPFSDRIHRMQKEYLDLTFVACQNTIDRFKQEQGVTAKLLPGVVVIDSGVAQIMRRQHQGWAYIQV